MPAAVLGNAADGAVRNRASGFSPTSVSRHARSEKGRARNRHGAQTGRSIVVIVFVVIRQRVLLAQEQQLTAFLQVLVDDPAVGVVALLIVDPVILDVEL